jgi:broad specificity phosphatase PhoE
MGIFRYLSHPQVFIDPRTNVQEWSLSDEGRARMNGVAQSPSLIDTHRVLTSSETKARQAADIIASGLGITVEVIDNTYENDRSSTGFLPPDEFERVADQFFAEPEQSVRGWETAAQAQERIVSNIFLAIMSAGTSGDVLCVGHGAVGTLLYCHLADLPISRAYDQPAGGGNLFAFDMESDEVVHGWMSIEVFKGLTGEVN